jgi:tRNA(fMet)-specific endonuclease VapC
MPQYLLDTNVLLHLVNQAEGWEKISARIALLQHNEMKVSAVTVWEIYRMAEKAKVSKKTIQATLGLLALFAVEPLTDKAAALGGSLHAMLSNQGQTIGERDSMIAATALNQNLVMVSDNTKEFSRVPGLVLENWRL